MGVIFAYFEIFCQNDTYKSTTILMWNMHSSKFNPITKYYNFSACRVIIGICFGKLGKLTSSKDSRLIQQLFNKIFICWKSKNQ